MTCSNTARAVIAAACLTLSLPVAAQTRDPVQVHVSYVGLDLATPDGQAALNARVRRAAFRACQSSLQGVEGLMDRSRCMSEMRRDTKAQVAALGEKKSSQLAAVDRGDTPKNH
jgi:UrcA family protein